MRIKASFGRMGATQKKNPNTGRPIQGFVASFTVWAGRYSLSLSESLAYQGINEHVSMVIFIRHNPKVNQTQKVQINGELYDISHIQSDDGLVPIGFDLVTLKKVESNG